MRLAKMPASDTKVNIAKNVITGRTRLIIGRIGICRGVAQLGSASALGAEGRRFESCLPDHLSKPKIPKKSENFKKPIIVNT
jgi:hypothetical protein